MTQTDALQYNIAPFETGIFGAPVLRLLLDQTEEPRGLAGAIAAHRLNWLKQGIWMASCRLPSTWKNAAAVLERFGFRRVETLITLERPTDNALRPRVDVALASEEDRAPCVEIGRTAFTFDRFHADPAVDDVLADDLKAAWVQNSFLGRADAILVVRVHEIARGFILCLRTSTESVIDLIAVAPGYEGRGFGRALVLGALNHYADQVPMMRVGTQDNNLGSTALYRSTGFMEVTRSSTYHWINPELAS